MTAANTAVAARDKARAFADQHAPELAAEILEWKSTALLRDGLLRGLAAICRPFAAHDALQVAESMATHAALSRCAALEQPEKPLGAPVAAEYAEELMRLSAQAEALHAAKQPAASELQRWRTVAEALRAAGTLALEALSVSTVSPSGEARRQAAREALRPALDATVGAAWASDQPATRRAPMPEEASIWTDAEKAMADALEAAWARAEPAHGVTLHPASYRATWCDVARAALAAAPAAQPSGLADIAHDRAYRDGLRRALVLIAPHIPESPQRGLRTAMKTLEREAAHSAALVSDAVREEKAGAAPAAAQPARQPLTEAQVLAALGTITHEAPASLPPGWLKFARSIEQAHGIGAAAPAGEQQHG